jgi:hypothetical protein
MTGQASHGRHPNEAPVADPLPFDRDADDGSIPSGNRGEFLYIGQALTADEFTAYVASYDFGPVPPDFIVLHHTAKPSTRASVCMDAPDDASYCAANVHWDGGEEGLTEEQIKQRRLGRLRNIMTYYRDSLGWDRGPHLFIDDRYIYLFSPMAEIGIHAAEGNSYEDGAGLHYSIGIEVVGYYEHVHWPPEIERLVGHCVAVLKRRLGTFELVSHPRAGGISSHRDYNKPRCPGHAITNDYYLGVVQAGWQRLQGQPSGEVVATDVPTPRAVPAASAESQWLAAPSASPEQAVAYIVGRGSVYTPFDLGVIVGHYWRIGAQVGLDPVLAVAQCILETSAQQPDGRWWPLSSWWAQRPRRNPAGIGVTGETRPDPPPDQHGWEYDEATSQWRRGLRFDSWEASAQAHIGRLLAYALTDASATPDQRALIQQALGVRPLPSNLRGVAATLSGLDGRWAVPGHGYGQHVAELANAIRAARS